MRLNATISEILQNRAAEQGERPAYVFLSHGETGVAEEQVTSADLDARARAIGASLQAAGAGAGERVALLFPPGPDFVASFFGCLYAGAVAVPALPPRKRGADPRLAAICRDARPRVALTSASLLPALESAAAQIPELAAAVRMAPVTAGGEDWRRPDLRPESLAFLQYTSGSTSTPKGVMVSHGNLVHNEELIRRTFEQSSDSVVLGWLPLYHDMGLIGTMLQPLYAGAVGYLMTPGAFLQRPARWLEAISRYRATTSGGPDFAYELCVRKVGEAEREGLDLSSWRIAFNGAEPVRARTLRRFAETFAPCGFRASAFRPCYGLAEATLLVSGFRQEGEPQVLALEADALERHEISEAGEARDAARTRELVGCGAAMQTVVVVDAESGVPCAPGRVGEVWVASPSVAHGYWERPEETAATFGAHLAPGNQGEITGPFLRTGDLGFLAEGELYLTGRLKDLIILRGRNHYPQDLELTAERSHADLRAAGGAAFSVEDAGEERLVIVHEVDRHARAGLNAERAEEIAAAVRQRVAEEHEVSVAEVVLIGPETLPRTSSGKVRRRSTRDLYLQGGLRVLGTSRLSAAAADEGLPFESEPGSVDWLRRAFAAAARIDPARVDPDLPLSASGLDSLAAVELKQVVEEAVGVALPLAELLEGMTLRELEARVAPHPLAPSPTLPPSRPGEGERFSEIEGEHPLSWNQRSLWFLHLVAPESSAYNIAGAARLEASSAEALGRAVQGLVERHPMLRATFSETPDGPVQRVAALQARSEAAFAVVDADGWSDAEVQARLQAEAFRPFDLAAGPLLRATLLRRGEEAFLAFAVHHIAADFWSMAVVARELGALAAGETLPAPAALYTDFAREQERMLASPAGERLWEHWRERLTGVPQLDLPTDRPRRPVQTLRGGLQTLAPSLERTEAVHRLAATQGCTPFVALLAAWQMVLSRWSGQEEFLTGAPMAGRSSRAWSEVVGYFVNLVPLRADLSGDPGVGELMARTRGTVLDALAHQDFPFALLTERLQPERDPSRPPLVAAMLTFEKSPAPELAALAAFAVGVPGVRLDLGGLTLESLPLEPPAAQLDLALTAAELPAGLAVSLQWDADLFDASTVGRMLGHLDRLLVEMAAADRSVSDLQLLSAEERDQILLSWSGAESAPAGSGCLHELFEAQVARTPEATALIVGEERWTYDVLNRRANRLAHHLRRLGAGPEQRVGVLMRRSGELIAALLGILKAGAAYVPLDPNYPGDWLAYAAEDADIAFLLTEEGSAGKLAGRREVFATAEAVSREPESNPEPLAGSGNLAYVIYTSGSTGRPKGVALEHRGAVERMLWARGAFPAEDLAGVLAATSICFDLSVFEIFAPLSWGGTVILADNALALPSLPARGEVTLVNTVPSAMAELAAGELPPSLRTVNLAGEALMPRLVERLYRHPQVGQVFNLYGPTEDTTYSTGTQVEKGAARVSIGRPLPGTRAYVLDRQLQPVPGGVPGELFLAGAGNARGYFGRPELTAEKFIPDPFATLPGSRLYRTGDLARWLPSGELEHLGRIDHQVKVRGFRIELGEIEAALLAHSDVQQAVVIVREVAGSRSLVAYVAGEGTLPAAPALREHLRSRLPEHMVPAFFVQLPALPLTPNGKVNRKALPAPVIPVNAPADGRLSGVEESIAAIWCEVLGLPRVGGEDNFFDLGGHSLLLPRVQAKLRERLGREVTLVDLLSHTTVRSLARHLETGLVIAEPVSRASRTISGGSGAIAVVGLAGRFPGAPGVESLWDNLCAGVSSIARLSDEELATAGVSSELRRDPRYVPAAGVLDGVELFDAGFFGYSPREAELMDPQQRLFLECAWEALEDAGYDSRRTPGPVGLFASMGFNRYLHQVLTAVDPAEVGALPLALGNDKDFLATRVSYKLDLTGPSMTVQTACSSSLVAVHTACRNLWQGDCDMALAGGVSIVLPQRAGYLYEEGGIASPDGCCRAFDASARGTVFGSGAGIVVLKRLEDALADGDSIRAVLLGSAVNNDGGTGKAGYTAPSVAGQAAVISAALESAGVDPSTVSYVEAHGTGTPLGDPIEVQALAQAFRRGEAREGSCALGSVKSNLGHLDTAAGVTGLIKTVLALQHGVLPPSLGFSEPNPQIDFAAGPFHVQSELVPWERGVAPRRAGVSSFGIGGTNVHAVLEEPPAVPPSESARPWNLLVLSARTPEALERKRTELADHLDRHPEIHLADAAFTLQLGRRPFAHRCVVTGRDAAGAATALRGEMSEMGGRLFESTVAEAAPPVVFLFPGQGSQRPGMGAGLYRTEPVFRQEIDRGCEILLPLLGFDLRDLLLAPAESEEAARRLASTEVTQPALFVLEHALARLWMSWGVRPEALIGHSIGEYVAACLAGVFSLEDALALVAARGRLVASLPTGDMLAVSLPEAEAIRRAEESGLAVAAVNAPDACVLSGSAEAVETLAGRLAAEGIEHRRLRTSHAFHSPALEPILDRFRAEVARLDLQAPRLPWISNLSGTWIRPEEATDPGYWTRHLREAVRFADGVEELLRVPGRIYLEVGPGRALSSLVRGQLGRSEEGSVLASLARTGEPEEDVRQVGEALGRLWLGGVEIDWSAVHAHEKRRRVPLPAYPFERQRYWIEGVQGGIAARNPARTDRRREIDEWLYAPVWRRTPPPARPAAEAEAGVWLLLADANGLVRALAERLERLGHDAVLVEANEAADFAELLNALREEGREPTHIVHGWSLGQERPEDEDFDRAQELGLHSLLSLVRALGAPPSRSVRLCVLSNGLHEVTGSEELRPVQAGLAAVARVIPQEHPEIACRVIDLERVPAIRSRELDLLLAEIAGPDAGDPADPIVAFRGGHRWVQSWEPVRAEVPRAEPIELRPRGVYLITGGLGKIGLTLAELLAESVQARLVLVGRTPVPERDAWPQRLLDIEAMGGEILPLSADVTDPWALEGVVRQAEKRFGRLDGVIHAAARISFQTLEETGPEECAAAFDAKVRGARALAEVLRGRNLDFVLAFSSLSAVLGGLGFAAYAAANACLDAFVLRHRREVATPWITVGWDGWRFPEDANGTKRDTGAMTPEEGKEIFRRILALGPLPHLAVSVSDLEARLDQWVRGSGRLSGADPVAMDTSRHTRPALRSAYEPPRDGTEAVLAGLWQGLLGVEQIGARDDFFELGGHSLMATRLLTRIREAFAVTVSLRDLFEAPTLAGLAARIEAARPAGVGSLAPPSIPVAPRDGALPLSFAQQRLWLMDQLEPGSPLYNIAVALRIEGALDPVALAATLGEVVRRHEALRTVFAVQDGAPVQVIQPAQPLRLPLVDLSGLPGERREPLALALAGEEGRQPFDLARGPLLRGLLLRLTHEDHLAALAMHHIASDGWSMGILVREVAALYPALVQGQPSPLPELPVQSADFAVWQRSWLRGEVLETEIAWWRDQLAGLPPLLELPTDRPRPAVQSYRGAARPVRLSSELTRRVEALARGEGATLFMVLLAGFQALLARHSGQDDLAVGSPVAGRDRLETEGLIGFFVNTLVLRGRLAGRPTFRELLGRARETALAAWLHQDVPFEKLVDELAPERSLAQTPLFQAMLSLQNAPLKNLEIEGLRLWPVQVAGATAKFDLLFDLTEQDGELRGAMEYATDLFDAATISRLIGHCERLLAAAVDTPELPVAELPLLSPAEAAQMLGDWNDTRVPGLAEGCLHQDVAAQAERTPDAIAVELGEERWTYRRLLGSARLLARHLRELGVGPDAIVGLCAERSPAMVVGMLAILEAGGAWLPLDPTLPAERLGFQLDDSGARVLLLQESLQGRVPAGGLSVVPLDARWDAGEDLGEPLRVEGIEVDPSNLAYVIYTSGSTGLPKGVMVPHRGAVNRLRWAQRVYGLGADDAVLQKASFGFDFSVWECFAPLAAGARLVLAEPGRQGDGPYLVRVLREHRVTFVHFVPSMLAVFLEEEGVETCGSLRQVFAGGEALTPELRDRALSRLPAPLDNQYGPTEISIDTTRWTCAPGQDPHRVPIGRPIANSRLYVVDPELRPMPVGVAGELVVGGAGVTRGYLRRPALTAERFVPDPFAGPSDHQTGERLYRTGDLARWLPDGTLDFLGRLDHQVKVRGFRIELGEIEAALVALPGVREAVVVVRGDGAAGGGGHQRLVAYVVADAGVEELRHELLGRLPEYMVPAVFVTLPALPLNANGKVDRKALPAPEQPVSASEYVAPRTREEEILAAVWAQVLGLPRVGVNDNFFEVGGDSILAVQMVARARQAGLSFTMRQIFEHQTVAGLARHARVAEAAPSEAGPVSGEVPLTPIQRWFFAQGFADPHHFNQALLLEPREPLAPAVLERAMATLVEHHDALRMRFHGERQENAPAEPVAPFSRIDLSALPAPRRHEAFERDAAALQAGFDLAAGPLTRLCLFDAGAGEPSRLLWVTHHLVVDGVSWRVLLEDLEAACRQAELPPRTTSFQEWSRRLAGQAGSEVLARELEHWRETARVPVPALPVDFPAAGPSKVGEEEAVTVELTAEETTELLQTVPSVYHSRIDDALLSALVRALAGWTGSPRLRVDLEGHGREPVFGDGDDLDVSRTVGWFTSMYPVVLEAGDADPGAALVSTKERLRAIPGRGIGYGLLEAAGLLEPAPAEVLFNYLGQAGATAENSALFRVSTATPGPSRSPRAHRSHVLSIDSLVTEGRLRITLTYGSRTHRRETVERLAAAYAGALRQLLQHSRKSEEVFTPSDFPKARLNARSLSKVAALLAESD